MRCKDVGFQNYLCTYGIDLPWLVTDPTEPDRPPRIGGASVDKCLLPEILKLWEMGIKTTGCCCGHGHSDLSYIGVLPEYIPRMKELGYKVHFNKCRPGDEDSFIPKTKLIYESADKGFNRWENPQEWQNALNAKFNNGI